MADRDKDEILAWMYGLGINAIKLGLRNITELAHRLGDPQNSYRTIHVAGTDGKGSTCAMIASALRCSGIRTGLYTSPHIVDFNERMEIDGVQITDDQLSALAAKVRPLVEDMAKEGMACTFFEVTTAMAFEFFREMKVEYAVIEVGMGGRFDATNIIVPEVSVITNISLEHMQFLGDTVEKIAYEKAGIIKDGVPAVTANTGSRLKVIRDVAMLHHAEVFAVGGAKVVSSGQGGIEAEIDGRVYRVGIPGDYQAMNAQMAVAALSLISCADRVAPHVAEGLSSVVWPCRMQRIAGRPLILDVSHTAAGSDAMTENIAKIYGRVTVVLGVLNDKRIDVIAKNISTIASKVIVTVPESERAMPMERMVEALRPYVTDVRTSTGFDDAIAQALSLRGGEYILVTGSFVTAAEAVKWLKRTSA
jgi:dihydrofolate synthase/folylpolyglutamate synthase